MSEFTSLFVLGSSEILKVSLFLIVELILLYAISAFSGNSSMQLLVAHRNEFKLTYVLKPSYVYVYTELHTFKIFEQVELVITAMCFHSKFEQSLGYTYVYIFFSLKDAL